MAEYIQRQLKKIEVYQWPGYRDFENEPEWARKWFEQGFATLSLDGTIHIDDGGDDIPWAARKGWYLVCPDGEGFCESLVLTPEELAHGYQPVKEEKELLCEMRESLLASGWVSTGGSNTIAYLTKGGAMLKVFHPMHDGEYSQGVLHLVRTPAESEVTG